MIIGGRFSCFFPEKKSRMLEKKKHCEAYLEIVAPFDS
jgi:hypothetical protein